MTLQSREELILTRSHSWSLVVIRGHSWSFVVIRGRSCVLLVTILGMCEFWQGFNFEHNNL